MDDLVNYLVNASLPLKRQQIYMQNMVQTLIELLFPFVAANESAEKYVDIKELIGLKFEYRIGSKKWAQYQAEIQMKCQMHYLLKLMGK